VIFFFPPQWKEKNSTMERKFPHGGKNKYLLLFSLAATRKKDKSGGAAA